MGSRQTSLRPGPDALTRLRRLHRLLSSGRSVDAYIGSAALAAGIAEIEALGELLRLARAERAELAARHYAAAAKQLGLPTRPDRGHAKMILNGVPYVEPDRSTASWPNSGGNRLAPTQEQR